MLWINFQSASVLDFPSPGLILMCLLFSLLQRVPVHRRLMSHLACCVCIKFKYSPYPKYTSSSSARSLPQLKQGVSVTVSCFLDLQLRAVLDPVPFPLAGQGSRGGGGRGESAVAAVPSSSLHGGLCIPVGVGRTRCPGALGAFSQHSQGQGQSFLPTLCFIQLAAVTEEKGCAPLLSDISGQMYLSCLELLEAPHGAVTAPTGIA